MKVVSDLSDPALNAPSVVSIGNFDGLHLGHQAILQCVTEKAHSLRARAVVLTFEPHPLQILAPHAAPRLITTQKQKLELMDRAGIELVFVARFDAVLSRLSPGDFIRQYLVGALHTRSLCVGRNFTFGHRQAGNLESLRQWRHEFDLMEVAPVSLRGTTVSSTEVRKRILAGQVSAAGRLLGRWFEIEGRIVSGAGRGRNVTVPTFNLDPDNSLLPQAGVYITRIALDGGELLDAITNVGKRPTFDDGALSVETFVLGSTAPVPAQTARLQFLRRVRDERRFGTPELLREQIGRDVQLANRFFRMLRTGTHAGIHSH